MWRIDYILVRRLQCKFLSLEKGRRKVRAVLESRLRPYFREADISMHSDLIAQPCSFFFDVDVQTIWPAGTP